MIKKDDVAFVTGCDKNTEWMLQWWWKNYSKYNKSPVYFFDLGVTEPVKKWAINTFDRVITLEPHKVKAWFLKPEALLRSSKFAHKVCWLDTDCEVLGEIDHMFNLTEFNKLSMVCDRPWTKQRKSIWFNSGVVLIEGTPEPLRKWAEAIKQNPSVGDQEVLHALINNDPLTQMVFINEIHNKYNWLRIQLKNGDDSDEKLIMHWTGHKGKDMINKLMEKQ